ncbi:MAG: hypothetical protein AAF656_05880 [Planctomycetota bacterium]
MATAIAAMSLSASSASGATVYSSDTGSTFRTALVTDGNTTPSFDIQRGDVLELGGDPLDRQLESISFRYRNDDFNALVSFNINFFEATGTGQLPTVSPDSPFASIPFTNVLFEGEELASTLVTFDLSSENIVLPDRFALALEIVSRVDDPDQAGDGTAGSFSTYQRSVDTGSSPLGYFRENTSGAFQIRSGTRSDINEVFIIEASAIPEPLSVACGGGLLGLLGLRRRR